METPQFCQSCAMPLQSPEDHGTEAGGAPSADYCRYCYQNGAFVADQSMEEAIEGCVPFVSQGNPYAGEAEARAAMQGLFPTLKRWKTG